MSKRQEFLALMQAQVGVSENPPGSNNVKYNTHYYGHEVNDPNLAWCATCQKWGMDQIGCPELYYGGKKTAYVPTLLKFYREQGQIVTEPEPGDWIFFDWDASGRPDHIGTVKAVTENVVYTLEGNVGDAFVERHFQRSDKRIQAYVRPKWPDEQGGGTQPAPEFVEPFTDVPKTAWFAKAVKWAKENGIVTGITGKLFGPNSGATRAQIVQMLYRLNNLQVKRITALEQELAALKAQIGK